MKLTDEAFNFALQRSPVIYLYFSISLLMCNNHWLFFFMLVCSYNSEHETLTVSISGYLIRPITVLSTVGQMFLSDSFLLLLFCARIPHSPLYGVGVGMGKRGEGTFPRITTTPLCKRARGNGPHVSLMIPIVSVGRARES